MQTPLETEPHPSLIGTHRFVPDVCPHYPRGVPDDHKCDAAVVLVGEAPGRWEAQNGIPFCGPSGQLLKAFWEYAGLERSDFYITNVVPYRPPANKIEAIDHQELRRWELDLVDRLAARLIHPRLIVPTGNTALHALTGQSQISKWRGSIMDASDPRFITKMDFDRCIPTLHPAGVLRQPGLRKTCMLDWKRIADELKHPSELPRRTHLIRPTLEQYRAWLDHVKQYEAIPALSIDIETSADGIICVGFAASATLSITLEFNDRWYPEIKRLCESECAKILQNGLFDLYWLADYDIEVRNYRFDTAAMFHALDPNAGPVNRSKDEADPNATKSNIKPYSLAYMASIFTRQPYYKDDPKEDGKFVKVDGDADAMARLLRYNGLDCCITFEIYQHLYQRLEKENRLEFYFRHYADLFGPLLGLMQRGARFDVKRAEGDSTQFVARAAAIRTAISTVAGYPLHAVKVYKRKPKDFDTAAAGEFLPVAQAERTFGSSWVRNTGKSISAKKLKEFIYDIRKLPVRKNRGKLTTDEAALRSLIPIATDKDPEVAKLLQMVLDFRRTEKMAQFVSTGHCDPDGRVRCEYKVRTLTGRLSSSKNPKKTGLNLQNIDRELRYHYLPDLGCIFLEADLSQAESRVVGALTGDKKLIELARYKPDEFDVHVYNAALIFQVPAAQVTKDQRQLGKRVVHASNYGMTGQKLSEILLNETNVYYAPEYCDQLIARYMAHFPAIRQWQADTRMEMMRTRRLTNSWGRVIDFSADRLDDEVFRRGYAFVPQSEVADLENQWGLIELYNYLEQSGLKSRINMQIHDAVLVSVYPDEAYRIAKFLDDSFARPRPYGKHNVELAMPCEYALKPTWAKEGAIEFKRLPKESEFLAAVGAVERRMAKAA